ncbi:hypothetical protein [Hoeflea sp. TYP-13]|uniref:hypothetical protein n=1 Tax=Hoeflea sp. TYP-13 TaxID=3230023 RepID=UPI0034C65642
MIKYVARQRMDAINADIRQLVADSDRLTGRQHERLEQLDRSYKFWQYMAS